MAKYRIFQRRSGVWYLQDRETGGQESLRTRDESEATRLLSAKNEAVYQPAAINLQLARAYISASDPKLGTRTWQEVMEKVVSMKHNETRTRWLVAVKDKNFDSIRKLPVLETRADHFLKVLSAGKISTNVYLRRIHNFALAMDWLLRPVLPRLNWPKVIYKSKRGITAGEHQRIVAREQNSERKAFYQLCWHLGGSQTDIANLDAEDVSWNDRTICYDRKKLENRQDTGIKPPLIRFGKEVADILGTLPQKGPLFPYLRTVRPGDRATEFKQRCVGLNIKGISLHSYRYAWAERARQAGYPLRFAEEALGHNSKAVHRDYARKAEVCVPCLDDWEKTMQEKMVPVDFNAVVLRLVLNLSKRSNEPSERIECYEEFLQASVLSCEASRNSVFRVLRYGARLDPGPDRPGPLTPSRRAASQANLRSLFASRRACCHVHRCRF